jgi:hypothetical protein
MEYETTSTRRLTFEVASFDIGYNYILGRPFLLKFMIVIHTAYATIKMTGPKGVITIKADQHDALACENTILTHAGQFDEKAAQEQATKVAKTNGGSIPLKSPTPKPLTISTPRPPLALLQPRRAHMLPQCPISHLPISRWMIRRGLMIRKFQLTLAT